MRKGDTISRLEPKFYLPKYQLNKNNIKESKFPKYQFEQITTLISDGTHFTPKYIEKGVKFLSVKDIRPFEIDYSHSKFISLEEADLLDKRCKPQRDDILLTKVGATYGFASVVNSDERFQIFVSVALLRTNQNLILPTFLTLCINTNLIYFQFERVIKGTGVPDLHLEDIRKIKVPVPPLETQAQIVALFETAYAQKRAKKAQAKALLAGIDGYLLEALGIRLPEPTERKKFFYVRASQVSGGRFDAFYYQREFEEIDGFYSFFTIKKLGELSKKIVNGIDIRNFVEIGTPYLRVANVKPNDFNLSEVKYISPDSCFTKDIQLETGDLLLTRKGSFGNAVVVTEETKQHVISSEIFRIQLTNQVNPEYLSYWLNSFLMLRLFQRISTGGIMGHLTQNVLRKIKIPLPLLPIQTEIATHITAIRAQAKQLEQEAKEIVEQAKQQVEKMILGE